MMKHTDDNGIAWDDYFTVKAALTAQTVTDDELRKAVKWLDEEVGHVSCCSAICGPDGETWIEEDKCDNGCTKHKQTLIRAAAAPKSCGEDCECEHWMKHAIYDNNAGHRGGDFTWKDRAERIEKERDALVKALEDISRCPRRHTARQTASEALAILNKYGTK